MKKLINFLFILSIYILSFVGCKVQEPCIPIEVVRDSIRTEYKLDSVYFYERDSVYLDRTKDTIYKEVFKYRYKDKLILKHDTIYQDRKIENTQIVRYVPKFYSVCTWGFFILLLCVIGLTVLKIIIKIYIK